ncbi:carbohydrate ABC transporter permease [Glycomyces algeriensis]|uniref:Sn-glycerol-3-phosphate transport system permease protein UgpE n=1 Tax=Glycomyces algeriensis TaxID=256037 RepID=A0A9W6LI93_9ACTN|nr:carbohydrate ABC transporter permease [Glycomyces algeriensis]MDA1365709.1 carbohydrate ABC transporter permease [Glycomyces algeriensis]MDR7351397.1 multiple sugar transport system permease protein [Glycomyces algeriensis]GLI44115.1 sn-glycerol-3-phosphate transport system permease protein UgpE [Glycomyces algeriensis]
MTAMTLRPRRRRWVYLPMALLAVFFLFPIMFMLAASFKSDHQIFADMDSFRAFLPVGEVSFANYSAVFDRVPFWRFLGNTLFITFMVTALGLVVNSMCGYALARMRWKGRAVVFGFIIATLILPFDTTIVPMVYLVANLPWIGFEGLRPVMEIGWLNTYHVQIVPFIVNAFSIFLFAQYFKSLPKGLEEAAAMDGAGWLHTYWRIIVPLSKPVFATVTILTVVTSPATWNAYLWPLMTVQSEELRPVMVGVQYFFQLDTSWGEVMAYISMITIPMVAVFIAFQRAFIQSIASAGMKD